MDIAVAVSSDVEAEGLVRELTADGYRLATVRLRGPSGIVVDLLAASSGIEREVVERAQPVEVEGAGTVPVARAEELLALKVLSMTDARPQDRIDARNLLAVNADMNLTAVRELLALITARGFHRGQDLSAKLEALLTQRE